MQATTTQSSTPVGQSALIGIFWSLVANWGSRIATFVLFIVLARFLTPEQYGVVAAASTILMFISLIAEFGMSDAIVQRPALVAQDVNLPFFVSTAVSILAAVAAAFMSNFFEKWLAVPGLAPVVAWLCAIAPLSTVALFQEAMYRRNLEFRALAMRALIGNIVAGPVAVLAAYLGAGIWSLVLLNYLTVVAGVIWLWAFPQWIPSFRFNLVSMREISWFGLSVVSMRVVDFFTLRLIDYIILYRFGVATLGVYTVGSRLYQVLIQLLQSALNNVSLSILSKIADERERMVAIYIRAITMSGIVGAPVFVFCSAVSHELCAVLFGAKWAGVDGISAPLLLLGALQCVQYLNGPYLSARGKPHTVLIISLVKYAVTIVGLLLVPSTDARLLIISFCVFQLVATPLTFWAVCHDLKVPVGLLLRTMAAITLCNAAGYIAVVLVRPEIPEIVFRVTGNIGLMAVLFCAFILAFAAVLLTVARKEMQTVMNFILNAIAMRRSLRRAG